jgi:hypothetical protein
MSHPVLASLSPIVVLVAIGFLAGRRGWIGAAAVKDLSNLVFVVLTPALLFRTMSGVQVQQLDFAPIGTYFLAVAVIFFGTLALRGLNRHAAVVALAKHLQQHRDDRHAAGWPGLRRSRPGAAVHADLGACAGAADRGNRGAGDRRCA